MTIFQVPSYIIWDITYACPLRCLHCYSESGRRPSKQVGGEDLMKIADAIVKLNPKGVTFAGGEPLLVREIFDVAWRISEAGIHTDLYTSGWNWRPETAQRLAGAVSQVTVSIDGATREVHDKMRGRNGSFDRAIRACDILDGYVRETGGRSKSPFQYGIDYTVTRSNFHQMEDFCRSLAPRFPDMTFLYFGAAVPSGLASRIRFSDEELLADEQMSHMADPQLAQHLRSIAPADLVTTVTNNRVLQMHPDLVRAGCYPSALQIEPDGAVRAMPIYEGTVGNILNESVDLLWERAVERWHDPFVTNALASADTNRGWAEATRKIDLHFGSASDRERIGRRAGADSKS